MAYGNGYNKKKWVERRDPSIPLTDSEVKKLKTQAMNVSLYALGNSEITRKDLHSKLYRKDIPESIIEETLDILEDKGYLNDARYAEAFVHSKQQYSKLSKRNIQAKLRMKGVDSSIIEKATEQIDPEVEEEQARDLARSRLRPTQKLERQKRFNTIVSFLLRRGYASNVAYAVTREVLNEEEELAEELPYSPEDE